MKKSNATKRALLSSVVALLLCFTMLMGATFAWFTDNVSSTGNIIKSGDLEVGMYWAEGGEDVASATWMDASTGAIFDYQLWEPGYVQARHLKIENEGTLALKYELRILANGVVSKLADVIDVYYVEPAQQLDRAAINNTTAPIVKLGTLSDVLNKTNTNSITSTINGSLLNPGDAETLTIAFKMQESAGNEYENLTIGSDFTVQLIATQEEAEFDSFDNSYDADTKFPAQETPSAMVSALTGKELNVPVQGLPATADGEIATLDAGFQFEPTETTAELETSKQRYWHADFAIKADGTIPANTLAVAGYYDAFCSLIGGNWVAMASPDDIPANTEVRLLKDGMGGISVNYEEICQYGNDGKGFQCGVINLSDVNIGKTITVELRLYETEEPSDANGNSHNVEVGPDAYITIGTFTHTIGGEYQTLKDGTVLFEDMSGEVTLYDTQDVTSATYNVPKGVTTIGGYAFAFNSNIDTIKLPSTVTTLNDRAFRDTSASEVILNEGLTSISYQAFRNASNLETVEIPSTVTTIGKEAFQNSGIKTLVLPETVTTLEYGSCRDMKNLETVTIEGNVCIPVYAFRACTNLKTVYLNGDDVTFGGKGMIFTNAENGDGSAITIYVANETVKERLLAADTAAKDYGGYTIIVK